MAITYVIKQRKNPQNKYAPKKWYGIAKSRQEIGFDKVCGRISNASSATRGDVDLALQGLLFQITDTLSDGNIIRLGEFGSFRVTISTAPADEKELFHNKLVSKARICFTPGRMLREMLKGATYTPIESGEVVVTPEETPAETPGA